MLQMQVGHFRKTRPADYETRYEPKEQNLIEIGIVSHRVHFSMSITLLVVRMATAAHFPHFCPSFLCLRLNSNR